MTGNDLRSASDDDLWFLPQEDHEAGLLPPLPRADRKSLLDPAAWLAGQGAHATDLACAAMEIGRLDEVVRSIGPGALTRLARAEIEAFLWAAGTPIPAEDLTREVSALRGERDLAALRLARWGLRRLQGQGDLQNLRGFLGLHRSEARAMDSDLAPRLQGEDFDAAAEGFHQAMAQMAAAHPITRGAYARLAWRLSDLSPAEDVLEAATWSARTMAEGCTVLTFVPMGSFGRRVLTGGAGVDRLAEQFMAATEGATAARAGLIRLQDWVARAKQATAKIKGDNPARIIDALLAHPIALTASIEVAAGISRDTAERLLARMADMGLVHEITGAKRFRLWRAAP